MLEYQISGPFWGMVECAIGDGVEVFELAGVVSTTLSSFQSRPPFLCLSTSSPLQFDLSEQWSDHQCVMRPSAMNGAFVEAWATLGVNTHHNNLNNNDNDDDNKHACIWNAFGPLPPSCLPTLNTYPFTTQVTPLATSATQATQPAYADPQQTHPPPPLPRPPTPVTPPSPPAFSTAS